MLHFALVVAWAAQQLLKNTNPEQKKFVLRLHGYAVAERIMAAAAYDAGFKVCVFKNN